jgi:hypothetical protein
MVPVMVVSERTVLGPRQKLFSIPATLYEADMWQITNTKIMCQYFFIPLNYVTRLQKCNILKQLT